MGMIAHEGSKTQISQWDSLCDAKSISWINQYWSIISTNQYLSLTARTTFHQAFKHIVVFCNPHSSIYFSRGNYAKEVKARCREHLHSLILRPSWNAECIAFTQHELLLHLNQKETTTKRGSKPAHFVHTRLPVTVPQMLPEQFTLDGSAIDCKMETLHTAEYHWQKKNL